MFSAEMPFQQRVAPALGRKLSAEVWKLAPIALVLPTASI